MNVVQRCRWFAAVSAEVAPIAQNVGPKNLSSVSFRNKKFVIDPRLHTEPYGSENSRNNRNLWTARGFAVILRAQGKDPHTPP